MPVFSVAAAPPEAALESPRTRQRKPLFSVSAKSLFFFNLPTAFAVPVLFCAAPAPLCAGRAVFGQADLYIDS